MSELNINISGYIREAGNLDVGKKRGDPKSMGIVLEIGSWDVTITGLTKEQCRAAAKDLMRRAQITICTVPDESGSLESGGG